MTDLAHVQMLTELLLHGYEDCYYMAIVDEALPLPQSGSYNVMKMVEGCPHCHVSLHWGGMYHDMKTVEEAFH